MAARLVGLDPERVPGTFAELEAGIEEMMPKLAYTTAAGRIRAIMVPRKSRRNGTNLVTRVFQLAAVDILPQEMRELYGYWWSPLQRGALNLAASGIVRTVAKKAPYEEMVEKMREQATVHAFGGRAIRINRDMRAQEKTASEVTSDGQMAD